MLMLIEICEVNVLTILLLNHFHKTNILRVIQMCVRVRIEFVGFISTQSSQKFEISRNFIQHSMTTVIRLCCCGCDDSGDGVDC